VRVIGPSGAGGGDLYLTTRITFTRCERTSMAAAGIRTRNPSKRAAADPLLRPGGQRIRKVIRLVSYLVN
jgi:hypothetical protein